MADKIDTWNGIEGIWFLDDNYQFLQDDSQWWREIYQANWKKKKKNKTQDENKNLKSIP